MKDIPGWGWTLIIMGVIAFGYFLVYPTVMNAMLPLCDDVDTSELRVGESALCRNGSFYRWADND